MYVFFRSLTQWLAVCLLSALPITAFADTPPAETPARVLIEGVPFVSIGDPCAEPLAANNPSAAAAYMMVFRYYRPEAKTFRDYFEATDEQKGSLREAWKSAKSLNQLRELVASGNPVIIVAARTPYAHELYAMFVMFLGAGADLGGVKLRDLDAKDYSSRLLGRMVSLEVLRKIAKAGPMNPLDEWVTQCSRVVVGLDPARRVVILHDPEFGPAWETSYDDFEKMWSAADRRYCLLTPKDGSRPTAASAPAYPPRTANQRAAECYLYGYSLAATGKPAEADERYRAGLGLEGLSAGYRFILLQERGYLAYRQKRNEEAIALLRQATEQIPQAPGPWFLMANICRETGAAGGKTAAAEFQKTAEKLAGDQIGLQTGLKAFPDNLFSSVPLMTLIPGPSPK